MHIARHTLNAFKRTDLSTTDDEFETTWNSLSINVKKIKPFSSFRQYIKNSMIDDYNTIIDS